MGLLVRFSTDFVAIDLDPEIGTEVLLSQLWDLGSTGVFRETDDRFVAGFDDEPAALAAITHLRQVAGPLADSISLEAAPAADHWQADVGAGEVVVAGAQGPITLSITAGGAFGHGGHATTRLALELLCAEISRRNSSGASSAKPRVLDVGTGTGVLAIAAAATGAGSVTAIDNDAAAVTVAQENLAANRALGVVDNGASVEISERTIDQVLAAGSGPYGSGRYEIVVVNVLLPVHRALAAEVCAAMAPGATLITAGYLIEQEAELVSIYGNLAVTERLTSEDWASHSYRAGSELER
ncbi:MAG: 50S ribosomal protein L11 methyltransferase [Acidimicrobiales bacterium]